MDIVTEILIGAIKRRMEELDWKVADLSRSSGISKPGLYGIVNGERYPGPDNLNRIATALGLPVWRLFMRPGEIPSPTPEEALRIVSKALDELTDLRKKDTGK